MNLTFEKQYQYVNWRRYVARVHHKLLLESKGEMITHLYSYVVVGADPAEEDFDDYCRLVWELGNGATIKLYNGELDSIYRDYCLIPEEETKRREDVIFV